MPCIDDHKKGFAGLLHIPDRPPFRFQIILSGNICNRAVGGYHQADGTVVFHHLSGTQFRSLCHGNGRFRPGGCHHSGNALLLRTYRTGDHIAYGVDHPHPHGGLALGRDLHSLFRHELRFAGHNGSAGTALGQFIPGSGLPVGICDGRDHQILHDPLDQRGFSGPHRTHHTDIYISAGSGGDVLVNSFHSQPPYCCCIVVCPMVCPRG